MSESLSRLFIRFVQMFDSLRIEACDWIIESVLHSILFVFSIVNELIMWYYSYNIQYYHRQYRTAVCVYLPPRICFSQNRFIHSISLYPLCRLDESNVKDSHQVSFLLGLDSRLIVCCRHRLYFCLASISRSGLKTCRESLCVGCHTCLSPTGHCWPNIVRSCGEKHYGIALAWNNTCSGMPIDVFSRPVDLALRLDSVLVLVLARLNSVADVFCLQVVEGVLGTEPLKLAGPWTCFVPGREGNLIFCIKNFETIKGHKVLERSQESSCEVQRGNTEKRLSLTRMRSSFPSKCHFVQFDVQ